MKQKIWSKGRIGIGTVITAVLCQAALLIGCGEAAPQRVTSVDTAMGTIVTQTLYVQSGTGAEGSAEEETDRILELLTELEEQELSWRIADSEIAGINAQAQETAAAIPLSASLQQFLPRIWQVSEDSAGALDVTVGKLSRLWNLDELAEAEDGFQAQLPTAQQIKDALADTGYDRVLLAEGRITLPAGMQLDLGAVGKGIACDRISEYLRSRSRISGAVAAVGGSVVTYGQKPDGTPWKVVIMHPREEGSYLGTLELTGEHYISTSGDYERYVLVNGVRYHHILDPSTGYPSRSGLCSATIVCDSGLLADALSTACFVLGPEQGLELAERYGAEALLAAEDGQLYMTEGMKELFKAGQQ